MTTAARLATRKLLTKSWYHRTQFVPVRGTRRGFSHRHALDLQRGVFNDPDAKTVARSLKRSAERSHREPDPFRAAMSMLVFYINRTGKKLPKKRLDILRLAKNELREMFRRPRV